VGGWAKFFKLLASEYIDSDKVDLSVAMFASLRGRHVDDLAGAVLNHNEAVLPQGRALHGKGGRGAGIGGLEGMLMLDEQSVSFVPESVGKMTKVENIEHAPSRRWGVRGVWVSGQIITWASSAILSEIAR
jgi:hypothetical protein